MVQQSGTHVPLGMGHGDLLHRHMCKQPPKNIAIKAVGGKIHMKNPKADYWDGTIPL